MRPRQQPVRRTVAAACGALLAGTCILAAGIFAFLGQVLHPVFFWFVAFIAVSWAAVGLWAWRDLRRTDKAMAPIEDTVLLDIEAIAKHRPPVTRRRRDPRRWLRYVRHRKQLREGAHR